ncbi:hypothetical protein B4U79_07784 [Dinothrombium tinctorium]|uniref:NADPH:adrenodoxin oxidoreductase, mitochondrial n=1 Tax=Dinothrombium tinctorium TaxID=1965070 RepID=A0A3S3S4X7_9ACAR|nr:hypothetical protein B4U79_08186 [Dinothrombium tinctorium]RWS10425.1 hypothetical protein B4U79_04306 [Dinothrombium tinctorium]RWS10436.1 hypothetical protein B4U79_07784 [Dinothrombium tinctorium]
MRYILKRFIASNLVCSRRHSHRLHVAVVGSGPSGFYTTQYLLKNPNVKVDIYEKYPVPFGLIRFGVAPDHQDVKNVIKSLTVTGANERVSFYGNVSIGNDVSLSQLRDAYNAVVLCYGSARDRRLNIEGENLSNVFAARRFVGWYNGVPQDVDLPVNLNVENVVIVGQGNVALDCARILLSPIEERLQKTDITNHALNALRNSKVKRVFLVGRRGLAQVAFTLKEFRLITKINDCRTIITVEDCKDLTPELIQNLERPRRRLTEFLIQTANDTHSNQYKKECILKFLRSPLKINGNENGVHSVLFGVNKLDNPQDEKAKAILTNEIEQISCGLVLKSIGYETISIDPSLPMDERRGVIRNENGRITECGKGLYCAGWAATGAIGVILNTMSSSFEVAKIILEDIEHEQQLQRICRGSEVILPVLKAKNVEIVEFSDWQRVDELEKSMGMKAGKPREKFVKEKDIIEAAKRKVG